MPRHAPGVNRHDALRPACVHRRRIDTAQPDASFGAPCERIAFDRFTLFAGKRLLPRDGVPVPIGRCAFHILVPLVARVQLGTLSGAHREGVWFVDLTNVTESSAVEVLAATLGIGHDVGDPLRDVSIVADRHAVTASNTKSRGRFQWRS
jgi:hypothetical protein